MEEFKMISVKEAYTRLREAGFQYVTEGRLRQGLKRGLYSFGIAILMPGGEYVFDIYAAELEKWIAERS